MNILHRILFRTGCLFAAAPIIAFAAWGRPVDGDYVGYFGISLPALACFAIAWIIKS